jgi:putative Mg2+ transporter-C (MgtC) family protein
MREGSTVKGLTTAASVWTVACLGVAAGYGYYAIALAGLVFALITLTILELIQHHLPGRKHTHEEYALDCEDITVALRLVQDHSMTQRAYIMHTLAEKTKTGYRVTFRAEFPGAFHKRRRERFFNALATAPEVQSVRRNFDAATPASH